MPAWLIPAAMTAVSTAAKIGQGITGSKAQAAYADAQSKWDTYNATMQHQNTLSNVASQIVISQMNTASTMKAAELNMMLADLGLSASQFESEALIKVANYNAAVTRATSEYNADLIETEIVNVWNAMGLDLKLLEMQRSRERGTIRANQAASGTVMNQDSNAAVLLSQRTQENLDAIVIRFRADEKVTEIMNAMSQTLWQGEVQARQTIWEGRVNAAVNDVNSETAAKGAVANALMQSQFAVAKGFADMLGAEAAIRSSKSEFMSGTLGAQFSKQATDAKARNTFTNGLFSGANTALTGAANIYNVYA